MRLSEIPTDKLARLFEDKEFHDITARLLIHIRPLDRVTKTAALASLVSYVVGSSDVEIEEVFDLASEFRESDLAEFGSGNCQTLDNPPKA